MGRVKLLILLGSLLVAACSNLPLKAPVAETPVPRLEARAMGQLVISVRWPRSIQAIPYSTNRITVKVTDGSGATLAFTELQQATGVTTSQAQLNVPAATSVTVDVKGYQDTLLIAEGLATSAVEVNKRTGVVVRLIPKFMPTVSGFTPNGGEGATVTVTGTNFGATRTVPFNVTFGGVSASSVFRRSDTELLAIVPSGVATGAVQVEADGIKSTATGVFTRLNGITAISPSNPKVSVGNTVSLSVTVTDASGGTVTAPVVAWSLVPADPNSLTTMASGSFSPATGASTVFTAEGSGSAILSVRSGSLQSTTSVTVQ